jgi:hypothetical protein
MTLGCRQTQSFAVLPCPTCTAHTASFSQLRCPAPLSRELQTARPVRRIPGRGRGHRHGLTPKAGGDPQLVDRKYMDILRRGAHGKRRVSRRMINLNN